MLSPTNAGKSVDNLNSLSPTHRAEFPFHSSKGHPRPSSRRNSTASSIHSIGGALDSSSSGWAKAVYESGQNAISTLLQPPIVRTGLQPHTLAQATTNQKPPTARDIPPVTLTNITHVEPDEFKPYLSQVGALYEQLRRVKQSEEDASSQRRSSRQDDHQDASGGDGLLRPGSRGGVQRKGSSASLSSLNSTEGTGPARRPSSSYARKSAQGPPPLSTIPNVYFDEDFRLENPRTFDVVSERSEIIPPEHSVGDNKADSNGAVVAPRKALATNAILQEKLSWYMDTIEVHLINSISTASTTFFTALGSLKELHSEAADSVQRIKVLRLELRALDEEVVTRGIDIVHKKRRQENLQKLNDAVLQLKQIVDGVAACESLVDEGEVGKALEKIESLEKLIAGESEQSDGSTLRDLRGASSLQGVNADLDTLRFRVGKAYETQFTSVLLGDLKRHVESVSRSEILLRWSNAASRAKGGHARSPSVFPSYLTSTEELKTQLLPSMAGLNKAQHVAAAASVYREAVLREIRSLIRRPLPSANDDDNESMMSVSTSGGRNLSSQEKSSILARNLRALDAEDAEDLLMQIYISVTETLRRLSTQVKVLLDIASTLADYPNWDGTKSPPVRSPMPSPRPDRGPMSPNPAGLELQEELHRTLDLANLLGQAVDLANEKIVKVLKVRAEQSTTLPLDFFLRYFTLNLYFANECEGISGRSGTSLKTVVNNHIKDFVQRNRDAEMQRLAQGMESDQWNAKDFNDTCSQLLEQILECSTHEPSAWTDRTRLWVSHQELAKTNGNSAAIADANSVDKEKEKEKVRTATIDTEKFILPNSAVLCLEGTGNFLQLITGIPSMTTDVASSLVAYLQLFNSRCTQLILGAGATRSAGLKNITTKHLALASQALSFTSTLIPHIREFVRRHAGSGAGVSSLMGEFDKVRRLLQEHQDNIHQKLVDIMSGRAALHARSMQAINWDAKAADSPHPYMETLAKETSTLHRVLTKHLPDSAIQMIMQPVFSSYKEQLGKALKGAEPKTKTGAKNMIIDVDFLIGKLGKVEGFADTGETLTKIAKSHIIEPELDPSPEAGTEKEAKPADSASPPDNKDKKEKPEEMMAPSLAHKGKKEERTEEKPTEDPEGSIEPSGSGASSSADEKTKNGEPEPEVQEEKDKEEDADADPDGKSKS